MNPIAAILRYALLALAALVLLTPGSAATQSSAPFLPSWNQGPARQAVVSLVARVTREGGPDYVPPHERVATFDNDGTLWVEQPLYIQAVFAIDRASELATRNPRLASQPLFKAILQKDRNALAHLSEHEIGQILSATHAGMTPEEFSERARHWFDRAAHPRYGRLYKELTYQPMLELLQYLRANAFKTFIVSGGGVDFMRAISMDIYAIPPEQVVGSSGATRFVVNGGKASLVKLPKLGSVDDKDGKPININLHIGRRPILAVGNSDGDLAMLQYAASGQGARLVMLVHHDDAEREYAYDRQSKIGKLDKALDEARARRWTIVSMKRDWNVVFPQSARATTTVERAGLQE